MILSKYLIPAIGAATMATALGLVMIKLIHVDFEAQPESEPISIYLETIETPPIRTRTTEKPKPAKMVEVPPAVDLIDNDEPDLPSERPLEEPVRTVEIDLPEPDMTPVDSSVPDKEAQPIVRIVAKIPDRALRDGRSGHCLMRFDVNPRGEPFNVNAYQCSHKMFEKNSVHATRGFKYLPKIRGGIPVNMTGVETRITYIVQDENGRALPET